MPQSSQYDTPLSPQEEQQFQTWKQRYAPKDSGEDYDLRGAFKAKLTPDAATGHWPDTFKKPNHPTFSNESKYAKDRPDLAGHWEGTGANAKYVPPSRNAMPGSNPYEQAIEKIRNLDPGKRETFLLGLPAELRSGIAEALKSGSNAKMTLGQSYRMKRAAGQLPVKDVATDPKEALAQTAEEFGQDAQRYQNLATPSQFRQGKQVEDRSQIDQALNALKSGGSEIAGVAAKLGSGLLDWKTSAGILVSALNPAMGAAFFATQGSKQAYDSLRRGDVTPDNVQNFLLGLSTVAAATAGGMSGKSATPGELKDKAQGLVDKSKGKAHSLARGVTESRLGVREDVQRAANKQADVLDKNRAERESTIRGNLEKTRSKTVAIERNKMAIADKNKEIEARNRTQADQVAQRTKLTEEVDRQSTELGKSIENVEQKVGEEADRKFEEVKKKIGVGSGDAPTTSPEKLVEAVQIAQRNILQNIPDSVKEFRSIMQLGGESEALGELRSQVMQGQGMGGSYADLPPEQKGLVDDIAKKYGGEVTDGQPVTWEKLQRLKTTLDAAMRSRTTSPIMKSALGYVRDEVVDTMGKIAEERGAGEQWDEARQFYRQWREDFYEPTGPSGSGSPVAQALDARDPINVRRPFMRVDASTGNRGIETLRKYGTFGGTEAADLAQRVLQSHETASGLPDTVRPKDLKQAPQAVRMPQTKPAPPIPEKPTVDLHELAKKHIEETSRRVSRLNAWDARVIVASAITPLVAPFIGWKTGVEVGASFVLTKQALGRILENPRVADWIARTPPEEIEALRKLPNIDKLNVQNGMTQAFSQKGVTKISPQLREFLGAANVAKIMAASQANRNVQPVQPVQNRKEALQRLGR